MKPETFIALGSFLLGLITSFLGVLFWYANSVKREYAAERDFQHLLRNQENISKGITFLTKEIETDLITTQQLIKEEINNLIKLIKHDTELLKRDIYAIKLRLEIKKPIDLEEE